MMLRSASDDLSDLEGIELVGGRGWTYRLTGRLGAGAQGCVFLATRQTEAGRDSVVVKLWKPSFIEAQPEIAQLVLKKEYVALARLNDRPRPTPFVVRLLDGGEIQVARRFATTTLPWLALEYVRGGPLGTTLADRVERSIGDTGHAFTPDRTLRLLRCVVSGVQAIHDVGVVHRDLKPRNVLMCGSGDDELAKVADFGLARPQGMQGTFGQSAVGTPGYAAPEQMDSGSVGPWSDVFSVAALAYFVIAGEPMFEGPPLKQIASVYAGRFSELATRRHLDPEWHQGGRLQQIEDTLRRATMPGATERTASMADLWSALEPAIIASRRGPGRITMTTVSRTRPHSQAWQFSTMPSSRGSLELRSVAFDPDGYGLALGAPGLLDWEGTRWLDVPAPQGLDPTRLHKLRRIGPGRWLAWGDDGQLATFTIERCEAQAQFGDAPISAVGLRSEANLAVCSGGATPLLFVCSDGQWQKPVRVETLARLAAIVPASGDAWALVGEDHEGNGLVAIYRPYTEAFELLRFTTGPMRVATVDSTGAIYAGGVGGSVHRIVRGGSSPERVPSRRELTAMTVDPADGVWAAAAGRILHRRPGSPVWLPLWVQEKDPSSPIVGIAALFDRVIAAAVDGTVIVGHEQGSAVAPPPSVA